jgi:hypothetical protein
VARQVRGIAARVSIPPSTIAVLLPAALISVAVGFVLSVYSDRHWWEIALPAGVLGIAAVTTIVVSHVRAHDALSPLGLTAIFYLASFASGGVYFWIVRNPDLTGIAPVYDQSDVATALVLATVAYAAIVLGYIANPLRAVTRRLPAPPRFERANQRIGILAILFTIGWAARVEQLATGTYFHVATPASSTATGASWFVMAASQLPTLAVAFVGAQAFLARRFGNRTVGTELLFYALLVVEIAWYVPAGSRGAVLTLLLMTAVVRYYGLGKRPTLAGALATVAIALFVVFPLEVSYRSSEGGYQRAPAAHLSASVGALLQQSPAEAWDNGFNATFSRLSSVTSVAGILHSGRDVLDRGGDTLLWAAETVVPRALDPHKADPGVFGNEFGRAYGFLVPDNRQTSIAITQFGELYLGFGLAGMVLGMWVVGAVYRLVADYFGRRRSDPVALAVFSVAAWSIINLQESIIAVGLFGLIKLMVFLLLVLVAASRIQRAWRRSASTPAPLQRTGTAR